MPKRVPVKHIKLTPEEIVQIEAQVFEAVLLLLPEAYYLLAVSVEKEGAQWFLQIFLERPKESAQEGISLQDCEQVSRLLDKHWDAIDTGLNKKWPMLNDWSYQLEISSPGLFRPLKTAREFEFYQGRPVRVEQLQPEEKSGPKLALLKKAPQNKILISGQLQGFDAESRTVSILPESKTDGEALVLAPDMQVLLNPVIHLEDEDSQVTQI